MGDLYILRPDDGTTVEAGHTISITREVKVIDVRGIRGYIKVQNANGQYANLDLNDWNWEIVTPDEWPAVPGDVWRAKGVRYAAMERNKVVILEPMNSEMAYTVYPQDHQKFLADHPVLVSRG